MCELWINKELCVPATIEECEDEPIDLGNDDDNESSSALIELRIRGSDVDNNYECTNKYLENLCGLSRFQDVASKVKSLEFVDLCLDDWEHFLTTLQESGANIEELILWACHCTERAARMLEKILNDEENDDRRKKSSFCIKKFQLYMCRIDESSTWIDSLLQNKTIERLSLHAHPATQDMPMLCRALRFILNAPQLKTASLDALEIEEDMRSESFDLGAFVDIQNQHQFINIESLDITFTESEQFPLNLCRIIGYILRQAINLKDLEFGKLKRDVPYNFLKDSIHCNHLTLSRSEFDPHVVSSLIQNGDDDADSGGKIEHLGLSYITEDSAARLFRLVDLSLLNTFHSIDYALTDALCHQLANNKGPEGLMISLFDGDLNELATKLAPNLIGNDKIEQLHLQAKSIGDRGIGPQKKLVDAMSTMPKLCSWRVKLWSESKNLFQRKGLVKGWKECILSQVESNWNIDEIKVPFELGDAIEETLMLNRGWRGLLCHYDKLTSGIWSLALSRIEQVGLMFRVVKEVPSLFQEVADASSERQEYRLPSFVVPHHPNCPGCNKRRRQH